MYIECMIEFDIYLSKIIKETITRPQTYAYHVENYLLSISPTCIPYPKESHSLGNRYKNFKLPEKYHIFLFGESSCKKKTCILPKKRTSALNLPMASPTVFDSLNETQVFLDSPLMQNNIPNRSLFCF